MSEGLRWLYRLTVSSDLRPVTHCFKSVCVCSFSLKACRGIMHELHARELNEFLKDEVHLGIQS